MKTGDLINREECLFIIILNVKLTGMYRLRKGCPFPSTYTILGGKNWAKKAQVKVDRIEKTCLSHSW